MLSMDACGSPVGQFRKCQSSEGITGPADSKPTAPHVHLLPPLQTSWAGAEAGGNRWGRLQMSLGVMGHRPFHSPLGVALLGTASVPPLCLPLAATFSGVGCTEISLLLMSHISLECPGVTGNLLPPRNGCCSDLILSEELSNHVGDCLVMWWILCCWQDSNRNWITIYGGLL